MISQKNYSDETKKDNKNKKHVIYSESHNNEEIDLFDYILDRMGDTPLTFEGDVNK